MGKFKETLKRFAEERSKEQDSFKEEEFTKEQEERIDEIYNAAYDFCKVLAQKEDLEWSMYSIGEIVETACRMILIDPMLGVDKIYFPGYVTDDDTGESVVEEYVTDDDFEYGEF